MRRARLIIPAGFDMLLLTGILLASLIMLPTKVSAAACTAPSTDYGTVTSSVSIPAAGTYRIWSRIQAPTSANNSYLLEIDVSGTKTCFNVGGNASMPLNSWQWINYQNGSGSNIISMSLPAGTHSVKMIGNKPDVLLDRVIFTQDTVCVPDNALPVSGGLQPGDNCADPADTTPPTAAITAPAAGATVSGANVTITATASDAESGVDKVEFYVGSTKIYTDDTDNKGTYSYSGWNTTSGSYPDGSYILTVRAYNKDGLSTVSANRSVTVKNTVVTRKPGDANNDGFVNSGDLAIFSINWLKTGMTFDQGDFDGNGTINSSDLAILSSYWNK